MRKIHKIFETGVTERDNLISQVACFMGYGMSFGESLYGSVKILGSGTRIYVSRLSETGINRLYRACVKAMEKKIVTSEIVTADGDLLAINPALAIICDRSS
jgi:hypothetical protein